MHLNGIPVANAVRGQMKERFDYRNNLYGYGPGSSLTLSMLTPGHAIGPPLRKTDNTRQHIKDPKV
jgi:hypothetical protein